MSRTHREVRFGVVVQDPDHWHQLSRTDADDDLGTGSYDDWAVNQLEAAMLTAGQEFIRTHSDLFAGDLT